MSRSYWVSIFAIGWLVLSGLALAQAPEKQGIPQVAPAIESQPTNKPEAAKPTTQSIPLKVQIIESQVDVEHNQAREQKTDQHDAEDLDAQVRAANAAERQIWFTKANMALAFIGTILIVATFWETRKANRVQLRAYINVEYATINYGATGTAKTKVVLKNTGQTPARHVMVIMHDHIFPVEIENDFPVSDFSKAKSRISVERDGHLEITGETDDTINDPKFEGMLMERLQVESWRIYIWGEVRYQDVFGQKWFTTFRFQNHKFGYKEGNHNAAVCPEGNDST
jgi:cell division septation protein DedD